jgi:hypothetical protein
MAAKEILKNPMVQKLIATFDLQIPDELKTQQTLRTKHSLNITDYSFENGFIVINEIELLDENGKHIKKIEPDVAFAALDQFICTFKMK